MLLTDLVRHRRMRAQCHAASLNNVDTTISNSSMEDDPEALTKDLSTMELELHQRDAYLRSRGAPSAETIARGTLLTDTDVDRLLASEGAMARLKDLYSLNEDNEPSYELATLMIVTMATFTYLNVRYTVRERREANVSFEERNKLTVFSTRQHANRRRTDYATMRGFQMGLKRSTGALIFAPLFMGGSQCVAAYRGKSSPFDFVPSGLLAGACVRSVHGLQPMLGGAVFGAFVGATVGSVVYGLAWYSGLTYEELRRYRLTERYERDFRLMAKINSTRQA